MYPLNGYTFPTAEHAFQAGKVLSLSDDVRDTAIAHLLSDPDPSWAKRVGRRVILPKDWNDTRVPWMRTVVFSKFASDAGLRDRLLDTGSQMLVEGNNWGDDFWGRVNGRGENYLGSILMEVRGYFFYSDTLTPGRGF
jgi:ribA/ribD-fused uncharacterized protein